MDPLQFYCDLFLKFLFSTLGICWGLLVYQFVLSITDLEKLFSIKIHVKIKGKHNGR